MMKHFLCGLCTIGILLFLTLPSFAVSWTSEGLKTNPGAGTLLADSGQLPAGGYTSQIICDATLTTKVTLEWRNSANTATLANQEMSLLAYTNKEMTLHAFYFQANERVRVVLNNAITLGTVQCSIIM